MSKNSKSLLTGQQMDLTLKRLARHLVENYQDFSDTVLLALQPRGIPFAQRLYTEIASIQPNIELRTGKLDITFYRDDFRMKAVQANRTEINHVLENQKVVLIDDVLYTGRSIRSALDAMLSHGRPKKVELLTLIDRRFQRELPIEPTYVGHAIDSISSEYVDVKWMEVEGKDEVLIITKED